MFFTKFPKLIQAVGVFMFAFVVVSFLTGGELHRAEWVEAQPPVSVVLVQPKGAVTV